MKALRDCGGDNMAKLTEAKQQATSRLKQYVQTVQA